MSPTSYQTAPPRGGPSRVAGRPRCSPAAASVPFELDSDDTSDSRQIGILGEERGAVPCRDRGDHAVHHPPRRNADTTTRSVDPCRGVEVDDGIEAQEREPPEEPAE